MSYYSTVKIVAGKNPANEIRDVLKNHKHQLSEVGTNERGDTLFEAVGAKWYEDDPQEFPDVSEVMAVVDKYISMYGDEVNTDNGMEYARVGDETDDVEYRNNGGGYGYLTIDVVCDNEDGFKADRYLEMAKAINPSLGDTK
jgi:hypothetical protein